MFKIQLPPIDHLTNLLTCLMVSSIILMFQELLSLHWSKCLHQKVMRNHIKLQFKKENTHLYIEAVLTKLPQNLFEILILKVTRMCHLFTHQNLVMCYHSRPTLHMFLNMLLQLDTNLFNLLLKTFMFLKRFKITRKYQFISTNQNHKKLLLKLMRHNWIWKLKKWLILNWLKS